MERGLPGTGTDLRLSGIHRPRLSRPLRKSCVLKLSCDEPVTIRENEAAIVEAAFREGYIQPQQPRRNGKHVAVVGSGPAGLTAANQLNRKGYEVTVFEKDELPGGLLRFGIPNFKLGKTSSTAVSA